jgi:hypothetical protein
MAAHSTRSDATSSGGVLTASVEPSGGALEAVEKLIHAVKFAAGLEQSFGLESDGHLADQLATGAGDVRKSGKDPYGRSAE